MPRVKLVISYLGTGFSGWQVQAFNMGKTPRTVQGELETALAALLGLPVRVHAAGRTDAGVHADRQTVHFDVPAEAEKIDWSPALRPLLPPDLAVVSAETAADSFHARFDSKSKVYTYCLWLRRDYTPPKLRPLAWAAGPLNLEAMRVAAAALTGEHDFASFQNVGTPIQDTVRVLYEVRGYFMPIPGEPCPDFPNPGAQPPLFGQAGAAGRHFGEYMAWRFHGNGFLKQMVRNLVGFLVFVGRGKLDPADAGRLFALKDRTALDFPTAPACGLTLTDVLY